MITIPKIKHYIAGEWVEGDGDGEGEGDGGGAAAAGGGAHGAVVYGGGDPPCAAVLLR